MYIILSILLSTQICSADLTTALETISTADSLSMLHQTYSDTTSLQNAICVFSQNERKYKNELAKAYYYLGHNYDLTHQYCKEVECFLTILKSNISDNKLKGQIYLHFESICRNSADLQLATTMAEKSVDNFAKRKDDYWYVASLMALHNLYTLQNQPDKANRTYAIIKQLPKDNIAQSLELRSIAQDLYINKEYEKVIQLMDSAISLCDIINPYLLNSYQLIKGNSLKQTNNIDNATECYLQIIHSSIDTPYKIIAYDSLSKITEDYQIKLDLTNELKDIKIRNQNTNEELLAAQKIRNYTNKQDKYKTNIVISVIFIILFILTFIIISSWRKKTKQAINQLEEQNATTQELFKKQDEEKQMYIIKRIDEHKRLLPKNKKAKLLDYISIRKYLNQDFFNLADKLENNQSINETEIQLCYLCLLSCSQQECAEILYKSPSTIGSLKKRTAHKLGTTSAKLQEYLIQLACKNESNIYLPIIQNN